MVTYEMLTGLPPWYTTDRDKLFDRLRNAPLKFPFYVSRQAAMLISSLLNRSPNERLGANGGNEVRAHVFFSSIDWDALYRREVQPPFLPCRNQDVVNTENFEKEFTNMAISVEEGHKMAAERADSDTFLNFTYEEESYLDSLRDSFIASRTAARK